MKPKNIRPCLYQHMCETGSHYICFSKTNVNALAVKISHSQFVLWNLTLQMYYKVITACCVMNIENGVGLPFVTIAKCNCLYYFPPFLFFFVS